MITVEIHRSRSGNTVAAIVVEGLERARCTTARETGVSEVDPILLAAVPLARSSLSITMDEKRKELRAVCG